MIESQKIRNIHFHGLLAEKFGAGPYQFAGDTPGDVVRGMTLRFGDQFSETIMAHSWRVVRGDPADGRDIPTAEIFWLLGDTADIHLIPVAQGSNGALEAVIGVVLIVAGVMTGQPYLVSAGVAMALGGVAQMLIKPPQTPSGGTNSYNSNSLFFTGAQNTNSQGGCVPIVYGRVAAGSVVVSSDQEIAQIAPDSGSQASVRSQTTYRLVEAISEGPVQGFVTPSTPAESIFLDTTPIQNNDGSYNKKNVTVNFEAGNASQPVMPGFDAVSDAFTVGSQILHAAPVSYATSASNIDAMNVVIKFPALFYVDQSSGTYYKTEVDLTFDVKLSTSSTWTTVLVDSVNELTTNAWYKEYKFNRPAGTGTWQVRVTRNTADNVATNMANDTYFDSVDELQFAQLPYNNTSVVGLTWAADSTNESLPARSYDMYGKLVSVPANYTPSTRTYTGVWDGTFSSTKKYTNNPVWILLDLLTAPIFDPVANSGYGLGIPISSIDTVSFYLISEYCDELVPDGNGGYEPRFTFNTQLTQRVESWALLQQLAATCRSYLWEGNGKVILTQDALRNASRVITKANTVNSKDDGTGYNFNRPSSPGLTRYTAANVTFNDPNNYYKPKTVTYYDSSAVLRYGFNVTSITLVGCTSEGQAIRHAKWTVDTSCYATGLIQFSVGLEGASFALGEVIKIADNDFIGQNQAGRLKSVSGSSIVLDRPCVISAGSTITCYLDDGVTIQTREITTSPSTTANITIAGAFDQPVSKGIPYTIEGAVVAELYQVVGIAQNTSNPMIYDVQGVQYDPTRYPRIESGVTVQPPPYTTQVSGAQPNPPTSLSFDVVGRNVNQTIVHDLLISWVAPTSGQKVDHYELHYDAPNKAGWTTVSTIRAQSYLIQMASLGQYSVEVYSVSQTGVRSFVLSGSTIVDLSGSSASALNPPTSLVVVGGGTTFSTQDLPVQWRNPSSNDNATIGAVLRDFVIQIYNGASLVNTYTADAVSPGGTQTFTYTYAMNNADNGNSPTRNVTLKIYARDTLNSLSSTPTTVTFTNPAPPTPNNLTIAGNYGSSIIQYQLPTDQDFIGTVIWRSTTSGFTPSSLNVLNGSYTNMYVDSNLTPSTTYYYRVASYDTFYNPVADNYAGTGLSISGETSATTLDVNNSNAYQLSGVTFTPNSPSTNSVSWTSGTAIKLSGSGSGSSWAISSGNAAWTTGTVFLYYHEGDSFLSSTTSSSTAIAVNKIIVATYHGGTNLQIGNGNAYLDGSYVIAGTVATAQLAAGAVTATTIAAGAITTPALAAGAVTASNIATGTITATQIATSTITGSNIAGTTITGGNIATGTITANKLSVSSLDAVSATIGTLRTASSGGRTEITDNLITVYDASNVVRVKIGTL